MTTVDLTDSPAEAAFRAEARDWLRAHVPARPPYSSGHDTTDQRSACSRASHSRCAAKPSALSREGRGVVGT